MSTKSSNRGTFSQLPRNPTNGITSFEESSLLVAMTYPSRKYPLGICADRSASDAVTSNETEALPVPPSPIESVPAAALERRLGSKVKRPSSTLSVPT